jgi:phage tail sheath protein FI
MYALDKADLFNILCIPPLSRTTDVVVSTTLVNAVQYCKNKRAMLIVDPPSTWTNVDTAKTGVNSLRALLTTEYCTNAATYFPRLKMADSLKDGLVDEFVPCGAIAGIYARTDAQRGVWKAPAGQEASLSGVQELTYKLTDAQNGTLNPLGVNCLRSFPVYGNIVWGARTLAGADQLASEWKYIPVRRTALFIEESLYRGTQWVVFEPNDEPLWAQIRLNVGAFMHDLFAKGAFQGTSPKDAYFVKCDKETTTQNDIDKGIVNILVGFAPLKPAEFVMIKIQQIAGNIQT